VTARLTTQQAMQIPAIARAMARKGQVVPDDTGTLTIQVPVPPSTNTAYATVHGRRVLTREGREYKASVTARIARWPKPRWLTMSITITMPLMFKNGTVRQFDASNRIKLLEDAVCEGLGIDDRWVRRLVVEKVEGDWGCLVTVTGATDGF